MLPGSRSQGLHADSNSKTRQLRGNISETSFYGSGGIFQEYCYGDDFAGFENDLETPDVEFPDNAEDNYSPSGQMADSNHPVRRLLGGPVSTSNMDPSIQDLRYGTLKDRRLAYLIVV